jgi:hypothetical protein
MSFFNKKEEVIEIELTSYGKSLLAKGKLRPTHYAFSTTISSMMLSTEPPKSHQQTNASAKRRLVHDLNTISRLWSKHLHPEKKWSQRLQGRS